MTRWCPPPASSTGKSDSAPKPRVAYTPGLVENMWLRKRTLSESSCISDPPAQKRSRRERINSEDSHGNSVDEAMGQLVDKERVVKMKDSLLKMNKKSLKELVDNPTSSKSRQMMKALVQEHRSLISNCLNRGRFGRYESCLNRARSGRYESIEGGIQGDISENDLDVLPSHVMVEISDMIKQEVPDIEVLLEIKKLKTLVAEAKKTKDMRKMASSDNSEKPGNSSTKAVKVSPAKEPKAKQVKDMIKANSEDSPGNSVDEAMGQLVAK